MTLMECVEELKAILNAEAVKSLIKNTSAFECLQYLEQAVNDLEDVKLECLNLESDSNEAPEKLQELGADSRFRELYMLLKKVLHWHLLVT